VSTPAHYAHWPKGVPFEVRVPEVSCYHFLETAAKRYPEKPAIIYCGTPLSYAALKKNVDAMAGYLQQRLQVKRGDRVLVVSQNCPQFVIAYYAIARAGGVVVPVSPMSTATELGYYVSNSGARVGFVAQELWPALQPCVNEADGLVALLVHTYCDYVQAKTQSDDTPSWVLQPKLPIVSTLCADFEQALAQGLAPGPELSAPDDLLVLPYTSGTTGHPKGCMHTHRTVLASNIASQLWRNLNSDAVFLCVAPLFHMLGLQNGMNVPISLGATVVMMPRWNAKQAIAMVARYRVSVWAAPPAMVMDFFAQPEALEQDLSSLSVLSGGGAAMPEAVATMLSERFGLAYNEAYGLSETASFLHANPLARGKRQCLGMPTQSVESRILDPETLRELPQGEVGELVTRGPQLMTGYWQNQKANQAAFVEIEGKAFFRTGDLAYVDAEGYFFMRDRLKRMINASGYKVWPAEVENAMHEHPGVFEACVIGVPDVKRGETVKALVVLKPEARGKVSAQEIIDWSRQRMAVYKAPRIVELVESLPKSSTGKVLWRELQEAARKETKGEQHV
jgi:fatty-acyl-CoA synthase